MSKKKTKKKASTTKARKVPQANVSPTATGPAGSLFEGQVGAHCLLALLSGEPRGLPGVMVDRVEFQRAPEGRPLDDIIVHGHDSIGAAVTLEIQVKREITFAPKDGVFKDVGGQIAKAIQRDDFWTMRYELAIATAKTSLKIAGSYQDLLRRARDIESADLFMERLRRPGASSEDMRVFVETFRGHLQAAGAPNDDETVWKLLRRMQILVFDFTAPGSADELLARERCFRALHPDEAARAGSLWTGFVQRAIQLAASGGEDTFESLKGFLQEQPFRLAGQRRYVSARAALAAASEAALADIKDVVAGVSLGRQERVDQNPRRSWPNPLRRDPGRCRRRKIRIAEALRSRRWNGRSGSCPEPRPNHSTRMARPAQCAWLRRSGRGPSQRPRQHRRALHLHRQPGPFR